MNFKKSVKNKHEEGLLDNYDSYRRKNTIKGIVIGIILGTIITSGIGVAAITLAADQVSYTPTDTSFNVDNTKDAIDKLYKLQKEESSKAKVYKLSGTSATSVPNYQNLTVDNFYYITTSANFNSQHYDAYWEHSAVVNPQITGYDPSTGEVTVSGLTYNNTHYSSDDSGAFYRRTGTATDYILCVIS